MADKNAQFLGNVTQQNLQAKSGISERSQLQAADTALQRAKSDTTANQLEARLRQGVDGLAPAKTQRDDDTSALVLLVMMQATKSARDDIKGAIANLKTINAVLEGLPSATSHITGIFSSVTDAEEKWKKQRDRGRIHRLGLNLAPTACCSNGPIASMGYPRACGTSRTTSIHWTRKSRNSVVLGRMPMFGWNQHPILYNTTTLAIAGL